MKISKLFTKWFTKTGKESKTATTSNSLSDCMKSIREREQAEKKRREKWSKELKQNMNYNSNYTYSSSIVQNKPIDTITTTNLGDSNVRIDGGENGRMLVNVPLIVNGRDVMKELDEMRDVLLLLKRDVDMEAKYPRLRELKDEYERALEKYKTFDTLKESK
jgi:hypothetical protein